MIKLSERQMIVYRAIQEGVTRAEIKVKHKISSSAMSTTLFQLDKKGLITRLEDGLNFMVVDASKAVCVAIMGVCGEGMKIAEKELSAEVRNLLFQKYETLKMQKSRSQIARQFKIPRFLLNQWAIENGFNSKEEETA
ncbi:hypothetical protein [Paenibacillus chitinolyticus]